ncbi:cation diffusion facilitator family transporter [Candidatus Omnitrophota bacterium]
MINKDNQEVSERVHYGYVAAGVSIIGNIILCVIKLWLGVLINSIALIADALHSLSDTVTSFIVIAGFKLSQKPADEEHPFGHGRVENVATLIISIALVFVGIGIAYDAFKRFADPPVVKGNFLIAIIVCGTIIIKEWMARFTLVLGKRIKSSVLVADAWHHRSDAISSALVIIAIIASRYGYYSVDAFLGIAVAVIIIIVAITLIKNASSYLLGRAPEKEFIQNIKELSLSVMGVRGVHDILVHNYGYSNIVSLHIEVEKTLELAQAHEAATLVERKIRDKLKASAVVHVDLHKDTSKRTGPKIKKMLDKIMRLRSEVVNYHEVNFTSKQGIHTLDFHVTVRYDMPVDAAHELCHFLTQKIQTQLKGYAINIHIEPCDIKCSVCSQECKDSGVRPST